MNEEMLWCEACREPHRAVLWGAHIFFACPGSATVQWVGLEHYDGAEWVV